MVAEKTLSIDSPLTIDEALEYVNSCDLICVNEKKYTKSIYFRDNCDQLICLIYNLESSSGTILATIKGQKFNCSIDSKKFNEIFNKHKIFMIK